MSSGPTAEDIKDALRGVVIPPKPQILIDIQKAAGDTVKIVDLISKDTGVSASLLKIVNSPFYGLGSKVTSIQKAVMLLGVDAVTNIVNALILRSSLSAELEEQMSEFWDTSMDVARAAQKIAEKTGLVNPEEAYTAGLFHNCGIPVLIQKHKNYPDIIKQSYADPDGYVIETERQLITVDHAIVGYKLCRLWNMDDRISFVVRHHHGGKKAIKKAPDEETKRLLACIILAEHFAELFKMLAKQDKSFAWKRVKKYIKQTFNLEEKEDYMNLKDDVIEAVFNLSDG
ncbi:MAG: HDOD domain-containing protein [Gammaproteobacteria bacterium]|nr:HDOD domain-containing protein [Gammaproteobacteria bacterium]